MRWKLVSELDQRADRPLDALERLERLTARLQKVGPNRYEGTDGTGSTAVWDFVLRSPRMHVLLAYFNYVSPHGSARIDARIVLIIRSSYRRDAKKEPLVQHDVEAFVKIDSKGWKAVARTVRPLIERVLEDQVREAGFFISLMGRLVSAYPNWACQVIASQSELDAATKQRLQQLVVQSSKPGALDRPAGGHAECPARASRAQAVSSGSIASL